MMSITKKVLAILLSVTMLLGCVVFSTHAVEAAKSVYVHDFGKPDDGNCSFTGHTYAYRFGVTQSFCNLEANPARYNWDSDVTATVALYKWDNTYEKTLEGEPIYEESLLNKTYRKMEFDTQPAGEYLFLFTDVSEGYGMWMNKQAKDVNDVRGVVYVDGVERTKGENDDSYLCGVPQLKVGFTESLANESDYFTTCDYQPAWEFETDVQPIIVPVVGNANVRTNCAGAVETNVYTPVVIAHDPGNEIYFEIDVDIAETGIYYLSVGEIWLDAAAQFYYVVDGGEKLTMTNTAASGNWTDAVATSPVRVTLTKGTHTIKAVLIAGAAAKVYSINVVPDGMNIAFPRTVQTATSDAWPLAVDGYSYRAIVNNSFSDFGFHMVADGDAYIALYKWDTNYERTVAGDPIASAAVTTTFDTYAKLTLDTPAEPGEYLFQIVGGQIIAHTAAQGQGLGYSYTYNAEADAIEEGKQEPDLWIGFNSFENSPLFDRCTPQTEYVEPETTAPETTVAPETAAPETAAPETTAPETTAPETTAPETTAPETTAPETTAPETTAPETTAPETTAADTTAADTTVADTTVAATTVAATTAAPAEETTAAPAAAGTNAPAATTAAETSGGCGSVVASASAIALVAIASAAAVVLKKKED